MPLADLVGTQFPKKSRNWFHPSKPHLLALESPTEQDVDLGYKVFAIQVCGDWSFSEMVAR